MYLATIFCDKLIADNIGYLPVPALNQVLRPDLLYQLERCVLVKGHDECNTTQRREYSHAVFKAIEWTIRRLVEATYGFIGINTNNKTFSKLRRLGQVGDMTPVQYIETTVREYDRPRERSQPGIKVAAWICHNTLRGTHFFGYA